jgi:hypothetical protein
MGSAIKVEWGSGAIRSATSTLSSTMSGQHFGHSGQVTLDIVFNRMVFRRADPAG